MYGGWYVIGMREAGSVFALAAGPWQDRAKAEAVLGSAKAAVEAGFSFREGDTITVGWAAFPVKLEGKLNASLWIKAEWNVPQ